MQPTGFQAEPADPLQGLDPPHSQPEADRHPDREARRSQHRLRPGQAAPGRLPRQRPHRHGLHPAPIRRETCPAGSVYGRAEATTPLLGYPLTGNVYLRSSSHKLPDLVVGFKGPASQPIKVDLAGKTDSVKGALRNTFEAVPDVPVSKFRLELFGGKRGLIELSSGFCANRAATVKLKAHSGKEYETTPNPKRCGPKRRGSAPDIRSKRHPCCSSFICCCG